MSILKPFFDGIIALFSVSAVSEILCILGISALCVIIYKNLMKGV